MPIDLTKAVNSADFTVCHIFIKAFLVSGMTRAVRAFR
jgi:hypothetical protein